MISACVITYNEEKNISRLIESLSDCDEIIIADGGSTDKTVELAKSLGANVYIREDNLSVPTKEEIDEFTKEFGYEPKFTQESRIRHAASIRNDVVKKAKNDWIFFPDADEFVSWNFKEIQVMTAKFDSIECKLIQSRDEAHFNYITKLYNRNKTAWAGRIHEAVLKGERMIRSESMVIDHHQKPNSQSKVYEVLEYCALKEKDARSFFYLGREYWYYKEYQKAIDMLSKYLLIQDYRAEAAHALLLMAKCAWQIGQGDNSRKWCLQAIGMNPDFKEALYDMHIYTGVGQSEHWKRFSEISTNNNVLFVNNAI